MLRFLSCIYNIGKKKSFWLPMHLLFIFLKIVSRNTGIIFFHLFWMNVTTRFQKHSYYFLSPILKERDNGFRNTGIIFFHLFWRSVTTRFQKHRYYFLSPILKERDNMVSHVNILHSIHKIKPIRPVVCWLIGLPKVNFHI